MTETRLIRVILAIGFVAVCVALAMTPPRPQTQPAGPHDPTPGPVPIINLLVVGRADCEPCHRLKKELESATVPWPVRYTEEPEEIARLGVQAVPTLILYEGQGLPSDMKEVARHVGYMSQAELWAWVDRRGK